MNILHGQGAPVPPRNYLNKYEVFTVGKWGLSQNENEEKLYLAVFKEYEILVTTDQGPRHQQNILKRKLVLKALLSTRWGKILQEASENCAPANNLTCSDDVKTTL